jgi:hypothetical protein
MIIVTPKMIDAAIDAWFRTPPETDRALELCMKAALEAALKVHDEKEKEDGSVSD